MILAIDIGNTNIVMGCIDKEKIYFVERAATDIAKTELEYAIQIKTVLELHGIDMHKIQGAIISSVVPPLVNIIKKATSTKEGIPMYMLMAYLQKIKNKVNELRRDLKLSRFNFNILYVGRIAKEKSIDFLINNFT